MLTMADWFDAFSRLPVEVPVREPGDQCISRNESGQAQPDVEVEERYHGDREQQKHQFVPVHEVAMGLGRHRVHTLVFVADWPAYREIPP